MNLIRAIFVLALIFSLNATFGQTLYNYKVKNASNATERSKILDKFRAQLFSDYKQKFVFEINKFNVCNNYAWVEANAQRQDGTPPMLNDEDHDCCHVEALLQKKNGLWYIVEYGAFATDAWFDGIWERRKAPKKIYGMEATFLLRHESK
jgi:hypothetical protein